MLSAALILLDPSAAFDTVDHTILLNHLKTCVGIRGPAVRWFESRTYSEMLGNTCYPATLACGVPVLFSLYLLPSGFISQKTQNFLLL